MAWMSLQSCEGLGQGQESVHWRGRGRAGRGGLSGSFMWAWPDCQAEPWAASPLGYIAGLGLWAVTAQRGEEAVATRTGEVRTPNSRRSGRARPSVGRGLLSGVW